MSIYFCCDEKRRTAVKKKAGLNGIDFLEVHDGPDVPLAERQRTLFVHFLKDDGVAAFTEANIRIEGGDRIRDVHALKAAVDASDPLVLVVVVDQPGDFSTYTLRLTRSATDPDRPDGFDPRLSAVDFSFKVECANDFDCKPEDVCPPPTLLQAEIDYLAKDYASFRRLMLDRLSAQMPDWRERNPADLGVALVELLAYVADHLSYQQDAIATEAYLGTARKRVSVRRHARLVDYFMHDGRNARAWVHIHLDEAAAPADGLLLPRMDPGAQVRTRFLTRTLGTGPQQAGPGPIAPEELAALLRDHSPEVFEPLHDVWLCPPHNEIRFYTWGDAQCCLPKGATRATLLDDLGRRLRLRAGDVLIFEERIGPTTGNPADADRAHRQAVRLTAVTPEADLQIIDGVETRVAAPAATDPLTDEPIVEIAWAAEDALAFPLCVSAVTDADHGKSLVEDVSVALGNIVLADHGRTITGEALGAVPAPALFLAPQATGGGCDKGAAGRIPLPPRFRPTLSERPLTHATPYVASASAATALLPALALALPSVRLTGVYQSATLPWEPARDLLNSKADDRRFVVEIEHDGRAMLRFGDDVNGRRPDAGAEFSADYRVGNGGAGNVGSEALYHFVAAQAVSAAIESIRNPLPAVGGLEPETSEEVRQAAPVAFKTQQRAVTLADTANVAGQYPGVQQAAASLRWTGSWRTVFITADRLGGAAVDAAFEAGLRGWVEPYRMAGQDVEVDAPRPVALELALRICVAPDHFSSDVKRALLQVFSKRTFPDGRRGFFHPDNFTFGQTLYLSAVYAAAQAVTGVTSVEVVRFKRRGRPGPDVPADGKLVFAATEIPRLDNDPSFPERGVCELIMEGGK